MVIFFRTYIDLIWSSDSDCSASLSFTLYFSSLTQALLPNIFHKIIHVSFILILKPHVASTEFCMSKFYYELQSLFLRDRDSDCHSFVPVWSSTVTRNLLFSKILSLKFKLVANNLAEILKFLVMSGVFIHWKFKYTDNSDKQ